MQIRTAVKLGDSSDVLTIDTFHKGENVRTFKFRWNFFLFEDEVQNLESTCDWLVKKQILDIPPEVSRYDVLKTEISLAFPTDSENLQQLDVFAYLPLRSCGFRFILNGDFVLPSSREDVDADEPW